MTKLNINMTKIITNYFLLFIIIEILLIHTTGCNKSKTSNSANKNFLSLDDKIIIACTGSPHVLTIDSSTIYLPSIFTPNHDGVNDIYKAFGNFSFAGFSLIIKLNGKIYYNSTNRNSRWEGVTNGIEAPEGLYTFEVNALSLSGKHMYLKGDFVLFRNIDPSKIYPLELCNCPTPDRFLSPYGVDSIQGYYDPNTPSCDNLIWRCR